MDYSEERVFFLEKQVSTLQKENESMSASGKNLLKKHNTVLTDMIANLNGYITKLRVAAPTDYHASTPPIITTSHREQKIPDPLIFTADRSKAQAWIMGMRLKLANETQLFRTEQAKMIYINSLVKGPSRIRYTYSSTMI